MDFFLNKLIEPVTNTQEIILNLIKLLKVKVSYIGVRDEVKTHPQPDSMLCITDVLNNFGVENLAVRITEEKLLKIKTPFISHMRGLKSDDKYFTLIRSADESKVEIYEPEDHSYKQISTSVFLSHCTGIALIVEPKENAGENDFFKNTRKLFFRRFAIFLGLIFFPISIFLTWIFETPFNHASSFLLQLIFSIVTVAGVFVSALLVIYEVNEHNPFLNQICTSGKKINCKAILKSKGSKILGVRWSVIGFSYFFGMMLILLLYGVNNLQTLIICSFINLIALPYIFYSIFYQYKIAKQWCLLCLIVQGILFTQFLVGFIGGWQSSQVFSILNLTLILHLLISFSIPFIFSLIVVPLLLDKKEKSRLDQELKKLKHDPVIFQTLLQSFSPVVNLPSDIGIIIGHNSAKYKLIKICNPYCIPCAKAHKPIEKLLEDNSEVQLQIIFSTSNEPGSQEAIPAKHLLELAERYNEDKVIRAALDDWYRPDVKNYQVFAAKYPVVGDLTNYDDNIYAMNNWCTNMEIESTPTFFLSVKNEGTINPKLYKLPDLYNVSDLKYILSA